MINNKKILIVGAGPTGLTLACALEKAGVSPRIIDMRDSSSKIPRAINISQSSLSVFKSIGINNEFWSEGVKLNELAFYWKKERLLSINYKYIETKYPYFFHLEQSKLEVYLNNLLNSYDNAVQRNRHLVEMKQENDIATVKVIDSNGNVEVSDYSYVIGCDGGDSTVRKLNNISVEKEKYSSYFTLVDAELNYQTNKLHYFINDHGYLMIVPLPEEKFRLIASFNEKYPGKNNVDLTANHFQKILNERGPGNIKINKIIWASSAEFFHQIANKARQGRVFLAGDALHQFSPVGGANMNTGIQDVSNLAEKLIYQLTNLTKKDILDLYESERLVAVKNILKMTKEATTLVTRKSSYLAGESQYFPIMRNRNFIKYTLPNMFSGLSLQ